MIKKLGIFWQRVITVALLLTISSSLSWAGMAAAQVVGNAQTSTEPQFEEIHYTEVQSLPDGGTGYVFYIDGIKNMLIEPPDGFSPVSATDVQLKEFGFPQRPKDEKGLTEWENTWSRFKHKKSSSEPVLKRLLNPKIKCDIPSTQDPQWSGYINNGNNYYTGVSGEFYQPAEIGSGSDNITEASWVGLGGKAGNTNLFQDGTVLWGTAPNYRGFYEYFAPNDSGVITVSTITVNPGDDIVASVFYNTSDYQVSFSVHNFTNGSYFFVNVPIAPNYFNGTTAEFIDERAGSRGTNNWLAKFDTITWMGCSVSVNGLNGSMYDFGKYPYERCNMIWNGDRLTSLGNPYIDYPWHQYVDAFTDKWQNYY